MQAGLVHPLETIRISIVFYSRSVFDIFSRVAALAAEARGAKIGAGLCFSVFYCFEFFSALSAYSNFR